MLLMIGSCNNDSFEHQRKPPWFAKNSNSLHHRGGVVVSSPFTWDTAACHHMAQGQHHVAQCNTFHDIHFSISRLQGCLYFSELTSAFYINFVGTNIFIVYFERNKNI